MTTLKEYESHFRLLWLFVVLVLVFGASNRTLAAKYPPSIDFLNALAGHEVSLGEVEAIAQDQDGFLWFGGRSALVRYDGYNYVYMMVEMEAGNPDKNIKLSQVMDILVGRNNQVWVSSKLGLFKFDKARDLFVRVEENSQYPMIFKGAIERLAEAVTGELVLATYDGLGIYNPADESLRFIVHHPDDEHSIYDNYIINLHVDTHGDIWIGTQFGVSKLDWGTQTIKNFQPKPVAKITSSQEPQAILGNTILNSDGTFSTEHRNFAFNLDGAELEVANELFIKINKSSTETWRVQVVHEVAVEKGQTYTFCFDAKAEENREIAVNVDTGPDQYQGLVEGTLTNKITKFYETYSHTFKVLDTDNDARVTINLAQDEADVWLDNIGLYTGDKCGDPFVGDDKNRIVGEERKERIPDNVINAIESDRDGNIWLGTNYGAYKLNPKTYAAKHYPPNEDEPTAVIADVIRDIHLDSTGALWFGSEDGGIGIYRYEADNFIRYKQTENSDGSIREVSVREIFEDAANDMWFGLFPVGISYYDRSSSAISVYTYSATNPNSILDNSIRGIQEDEKGNVWLGSQAGIHYWERKKGHFKYYTQDNGLLPSNSIQSLFLDREGDVWAGTWGSGFSRLKKGEKAFEQMPFEVGRTASNGEKSKSLINATVWSIAQDSKGDLWFGTHNGGLHHFNKETEEFTVYVNVAEDENTLSNNLVWSILEDRKGFLWVGTTWGLSRRDPKTGNFHRYYADESDARSLSDNTVMGLYEDSKGTIWASTDRGINKYVPASDDFTVYTIKEGLVDNGGRSFAEDNDGKLWVTTMNGFSVFDPEAETFKNFTKYNGEVIGGFNIDSTELSSRGEIMMGSGAGLRIYNVQEMKGNRYVPPIVLTDFQLFTKSVKIGGADGLLSKQINLSEEIILDYKKTMISFTFAALNYRNTYANQYAYKLDGFDDDWRYVGGNRSAVYTNLDAGNYVFRVKGSNNDGVWSKEDKTIKIKQLPAPWLTIWAKLFYAAVVLFIIYQYILYQRRKREAIERQNIILEEKVAERTVELRKKNNDIQAMLSNMRQGLFTIVEELKIHQEYSKFLERIFETENIADQDAVELLLGKANVSADMKDEVFVSLNTILGEHPMNFDFNAHLLIQEYQIDLNGKEKHLSLEWNPIVEDGFVGKVMVSVRDVTQLKLIEGEARSQQRELNIISQLIKVNDAQFLDFEENTASFIEQAKQRLDEKELNDQPLEAEDLELLFRLMHTIKGSARTHKFTYMSEVAHNAESNYASLRRGEEGEEPFDLQSDLAEVKASMDEYRHVFEDVLERGDKSSSSGSKSDGLDAQGVEKLRAGVDEMLARFESVKEIAEISESFAQLIDESMSLSLEQVLTDLLASLPSIADDLGKQAPFVEIDCSDLRIRPNSVSLIKNTFAHILRNCVDHGIESSPLRLEKGKSENGNIMIQSNVSDSKQELRIYDDGQGLNIRALYDKGLKEGLWCEADKPSDLDIASLIFHSGVSTKDVVTDISGRGVGMDAVKAFLQERGGDISLQVGPRAKGEDFASVQFIMSLPLTEVVRVSNV